jgi:hypothetical protein
MFNSNQLTIIHGSIDFNIIDRKYYATVSNPVLAWTASLIAAATGANQSSSLTTTVNITNGWEIQIPVKVQFSNVSADAVINAYPSNDGGTAFDSNPAFSISVARVSGGGLKQTSIRLPVGQYALQLLNSGPSSSTFQVLTTMVVTAIANV